MVSRRRFLSLCGVSGTLGVCALASWSCRPGGESSEPKEGAVTIGSIDSIGSGETVLDLYRLVIVRDAQGIGAMSLVCTHQTCLLSRSPNGYSCPCHGSEFDGEGARKSGPAPRSLPWFRISLDANRQIVVHLADEVPAAWRLAI